jgi:hypothetical protein
MDWEQHYRRMNREYSAECKFGHDPAPIIGGFFDDAWHAATTPIDQQVADFTLAKDNLIAVNDYMHRTPSKTAPAASLLSDWARWWDATGNPANYSIQIPPAVWDEARNRRVAFDLANAKTKAEQDLIIHTATTGMSSEQMQGLPDRRDPNTGLYFVPPPPPAPLFPSWVKPLAIGAVALGLGLSVVPTLRKLILHV